MLHRSYYLFSTHTTCKNTHSTHQVFVTRYSSSSSTFWLGWSSLSCLTSVSTSQSKSVPHYTQAHPPTPPIHTHTHAHTNSHLQRQIQLCGLHPQSPLALKEIQFLRTLCLKVHSDSRLADFLLAELPIKRSPLAPPSPSSSSSLSTSPTINNSPSPPSSSSAGTTAKKTVYLVAEALQRLVNHNDNLVAMKAYECLLNCVSLHHEGVARVLASSQLPVLLASKLQYHFQLIPLSCPHTAIVGCNTGWG